MSHPDMLEGDAQPLPPDCARRADWLRLERARKDLEQAVSAEDRVRTTLTYQAELALFASRYWTDMRTVFGGRR